MNEDYTAMNQTLSHPHLTPLHVELAEQKIRQKQAEGRAETTKEDLEVQKIVTATAIAKAELAYTLAELEREKYIEGEYGVALNKSNGAIKLAEKDLQEAEEKLANS